jgi:hypothetical protein
MRPPATPPKPGDVALARSHELKHERRQSDDCKVGSGVLYTAILAGVMTILTRALRYVLGLR